MSNASTFKRHMKRLLFTLATLVLIVAAVPSAQAQPAVSVDFFYSNLNGGSWIDVERYGYCWQPDLAVSDPAWRPYADGYWAYTDEGWTWVSYEDFGWATYHYGRWVRLSDYGWVWVPGQEWAPAWVSWRTGGSHIGWAPLPPETERIYESRPLTGHLDIEFDIGPAYYNFVDIRYIGEPALSHRIVPVQENVTYINQTVNVTNITYKNKTVYNYGPDINVINQNSSRPIQRLKLERQQNVDLNAAAKSGGLTKVQGNSLVVAAPARFNKPAQPVAPPTVKAKVAQPKIEHGWSVVGDANAQTQLKEKIKTQDLKNVPPATAGGGAAAAVSPAPSAPSTMTATPFERGKGRGKAAEQSQPGPTLAPATSPVTTPVTTPELGKGRKGKNREQFGQPPVPAPTTKPEATTAPFKGNRKQGTGLTPQTNIPGGPEGGLITPRSEPKHKAVERGFAPTPGPTTDQPENLGGPKGKRKQFEQPGAPVPQTRVPTSTGSQGMQNIPSGEGRGKHKVESAGPPTTTAPQGTENIPSGEGRGKHKVESAAPPANTGQPAPGAPGREGKQKKGEKASPSPLPQ
jgi:hypothetical protein